MNKTVAERDDPLLVCYAIGDLREVPKRLTESLADDLEVTFHRSAQHRVALIVVQLLAARKRQNVADSPLHVPKVSPQATRHTAVPGAIQFLAESMDCERNRLRPGPHVDRKDAPAPRSGQNKCWHTCRKPAARIRPPSRDRCGKDRSRRAAPSRRAPGDERDIPGKSQQFARVSVRLAGSLLSPVGQE